MTDNETRSLVSLRDYVDTRLAALDKAMELATRILDKRLDSMNEIRGSMRDQAATMATRQELQAKLDIVDVELRSLREFRVALEAKASQQSVNVALALSLIGLAISIVKLFM